MDTNPSSASPRTVVTLIAELGLPCSVIGHLFIPSMNTDQASAMCTPTPLTTDKILSQK